MGNEGAVAHDRHQESVDAHVRHVPSHGFRMLPRKGTVATEPGGELPATCLGSQEQRPENVRLGNTERLLAIHFVVKTMA